MKKRIWKFISAILIASVVLLFMAIPVSAVDSIGNISTSPIETPEKIICRATIDDDFADDSVLVVLKNGANPTFKTLTQSDFPEIDIKSIDCLNNYSASIVKSVRQIKNTNVQTMAVSNGTTNSAMDALSAATGYSESELTTMEQKFNFIYRIELQEKGKQKVLDAIKELEKRDDVYAAEPDYTFELCSNNSSNTEDEDFSQQWAIDVLDLPEAWEFSSEIMDGEARVKVGVIDSGIQYDHPDLSENIDLSLSRDFTSEGNNTTTDDAGHGTYVSGFIGSKNDDGTWINGVYKNVKLVSLRVYNEREDTTTSSILRAIDYADQQEIRILNISANLECFGGDGSSQVTSLMTRVNSYNGIIICAAGNEDVEIQLGSNANNKYYLASMNFAKIIAVTSTDINDNFVEGHCYGVQTVDLAAPGKDLWTATTGQSSIIDDGTSWAAPYVTGVAALYMSMYPKPNNVTWEDYLVTVRNAILTTVDEVPSLTGKVATGGRLNAYSALRYGDPYYKIKYNANGGTGVMADTRAFHDTEREIRTNAFVRDGGVFKGWNAYRSHDQKWYYQNSSKTQFGWYTQGQQPYGWTKKLFLDGESVYNLSNISTTNYENNTVTFYAQWTSVYTIEYYKNGGTGEMDSTTVLYGTSDYISENEFTRTNYLFDCWFAYRESDGKWRYKNYDQSSSGWYAEGSQPSGWTKFRYEDGDTAYNISSVYGDIIRFYAQWTPSYTIVYNANGGVGTMENTIAGYGIETPLSENTYVWDNHEFVGWIAKRNSDDKLLYFNTNTAEMGWYIEGQQPEYWERYVLSDGDWVVDLESTPGATVTLYAMWRECYRIQYDANGGEGTMQDTVVYQIDDSIEIVELPECTFTKEGYVFGGWYVYDTVCDSWAYSSYTSNYLGWYYEGDEPDGWYKHVFEDQTYFDVAHHCIPTTYIFYAVWWEI